MSYSKKLLEWYELNQRPLPFRQGGNPYHVWVSEIMAQQTRIDSMIPYYLKWIKKWPTVESLAKADIEDILHCWQGLGYYNRARKLHEGAKYLVQYHQALLPQEVNELLQVPGIGPYSAGAIASICFKKRAPAVDGNVLRVVTRNHCINQDITKKKTVDFVHQIVYENMVDSDPSIFTQALMELGALVCTPKKPQCDVCPIFDECLAFKNNNMLEFPIKKSAKKPLELNFHTYFIMNHHQQVLMSSDDSDGLMKGLWRLPQFEKPLDLDAEFVMKRKHVFSHRIWHMNCYVGKVSDIILPYTTWVHMEELKDLAIVTGHAKWINAMVEENRLW